MEEIEEVRDRKLYDSVFIVLSACGVVSNAFLLLCIQRNPFNCFRNSSSYLVAHQAFCDLVTCFFIATFYLALFSNPSIFQFFPAITKIIIVLASAGFLALFLVSLDRFLAIRFPIRYRIHVDLRLVPMVIVPIWLGTVATILLIVFKPNSFNGLSMVFLSIGGAFVFVKLCLHCLAFWTIKRKSSKIRQNNNSSSAKGQLVALKREGRFLFTVFLITVLVFLTTSPLLCHLYRSKTPFQTFRGCIVLSLYLLGITAGPCIYFVRLNNYSTSFKKIMCSRYTSQ